MTTGRAGDAYDPTAGHGDTPPGPRARGPQRPAGEPSAPARGPYRSPYGARPAGRIPPAPAGPDATEVLPRVPAGPDATEVLPRIPAGPDATEVLPLVPPGPMPPVQPPQAPPGPMPTAQLPPAPAGPGRAERRRAAKGGRGRRRPMPPEAAQSPVARPGGGVGGPPPPGGPGRPLTRVEARRAARAAKDSPAVIASRAMGELFITFGVLMLLFVTYQLWWTNIRAGQEVDRETSKIQEAWAKGREPDAFAPGQGFAIMHIPKLDVVVPVAAGVDNEKVLDRGMVGHYNQGGLKTALPSDPTGNFAVAGHRNTHGEPFRYINRLEPGDPIVVETQDTYYTYTMASILQQTPPSNVQTISAVPAGSGFTAPGRYITLTTCTPEFTRTYRMIVWGKMVEERPRSKGKPDALVG
ncbi:class E sortase [Streptomyces sp. NPDC020141]|uniref:class E sortase n=1 Tax=Streptomyces sp. NPDC020141 TaxID=3365065 RepID=UPI0037A19C04